MSRPLNVVVLVKQVPDSGAPRSLTEGDATVDRESGDLVVNEMDEYAIEEALRIRTEHGGRVILLTMGPPEAVSSIRKALQMGADEAIHITDSALAGTCAVKTSLVLAAALRTIDWDLVLCGAEATDGQLAVVPAMLAARLEVAALTNVRKLTVSGAETPSVEAERQTETGYQRARAALPVVVSVTDTINQPHYPNFRDIMAAKSKTISTLSLADLGVDPAEVGSAGATSVVDDFSPRPPKGAGVIVPAGEQAVKQLVEFLVDRKVI